MSDKISRWITQMPFWQDAKTFLSDRRRRKRLQGQRARLMIRGTQLRDEHLLPPLPVLPAERPRPLTPSPSDEDLCQSVANATANSAFFQRLPPEIRRQILIEAFGGHAVHMDLRFDHPELPLDPEAAHKISSHCRHNIDWENRYRGPPPAWNLDHSVPKRWIWQSSVCHERDFQGWYGKRRLAGTFSHPAEDRCRFGDISYDLCRLWPGEESSRCFIGAMGWLLSCRAAYIEGIDVLYGTNVIHTASKQMILNLDRILLPQRLSAIRSVELVWEFEPFPWPSGKRVHGLFTGLEYFHHLLERVPGIFPSLRSLYIAPQGNLGPWKSTESGLRYDRDRCVEMLEKHLMQPMDNMVRRLGPHTQECVIALPSGEYCMWRKSVLGQADVLVEQVHRGAKHERSWRRVDGSANLGGYWVQLGRREHKCPIICTFGEGGGWCPSNEDRVFYGTPWYSEELPWY